VRSLSGVLAERLPGFAEALGAKEVLDSTADKDVFEIFLAQPLARMAAPAAPVVIVLDALDEIPPAKLPAVLRLFRGAMLKLPAWVRFFVTSREDLQIKTALAHFKPTELLVDEARNLQVYAFQNPKSTRVCLMRPLAFASCIHPRSFSGLKVLYADRSAEGRLRHIFCGGPCDRSATQV
jgi:hypothetical protein